MELVVACVRVPFPPLGGAAQRSSRLALALARRHRVRVVGLAPGGPGPGPLPGGLEVGEVAHAPAPLYAAMRGSDREVARAAAVALAESREPWFASCLAVPALGEAIAAAARGADLVLFEGSDIARFAPLLPPGVPYAVDFLDVYTRMLEREAAAATDPEASATARREAERARAYEGALARGARLCLVCSEAEAAAARGLGASAVAVVANGVDTARLAPLPVPAGGSDLVFTGSMSYDPNVEAVTWFASEVLPAVRARHPGARLHVVGDRPAPAVLRLAGEAVVVHGRVADVLPFLQRAAVVVAPLRRGGGTRLKVLEAAAAGAAIVGTTLAFDGLDLVPGRDVLAGDDPASMAEAIALLLGRPGRRAELGRRARAASLAYDWSRIEAGFLAAVEAVLPSPAGDAA